MDIPVVIDENCPDMFSTHGEVQAQIDEPGEENIDDEELADKS